MGGRRGGSRRGFRASVCRALRTFLARRCPSMRLGVVPRGGLIGLVRRTGRARRCCCPLFCPGSAWLAINDRNSSLLARMDNT